MADVQEAGSDDKDAFAPPISSTSADGSSGTNAADRKAQAADAIAGGMVEAEGVQPKANGKAGAICDGKAVDETEDTAAGETDGKADSNKADSMSEAILQPQATVDEKAEPSGNRGSAAGKSRGKTEIFTTSCLNPKAKSKWMGKDVPSRKQVGL